MMDFIGKLSGFVGKNLTYIVLVVVVAAYFMPSAFLWAVPHTVLLLGVIMFGMGMTLTVADFKTVFKRPWEVLIGIFAQFLIMPFVAWGLVRIFALPPELAIGVILVGTCPGGTASNVISYLAKGDVALSVSMTMATTLLAPIVTPALTWLLAGAWIHVSFLSMMISIVQMVLVPVLLGLGVNHFFARGVEKVLPAMPVVSVVTIVILVGCVVSLSASRLFDVGLLMAVIVVLHNVFGLTLGYLMAKLFRLDSKKSRTVAIEVGMQNSGMAASLAVLYFNPAAAIPGAIFSVWHNISGSLIANYFSRRDEKRGAVCVKESTAHVA